MTDTSGPAFPFTPNPQPRNMDGTWSQEWEAGLPGMTRRQWLAGMAMQGSLTHECLCGKTAFTEKCAEDITKYAYLQADAMLRYEREEGK